MAISEQGTRFYFRAINSFERIQEGDTVLIDTECEVTPCSIVLAAEDLILQKAQDSCSGWYGKVVVVYIGQ